MGSDSEATTLRLGQAPPPKAKAKSTAKAGPKKKNTQNARGEHDAEESDDTAKKDSLRTMQWEVIHEAQKKIKKSNPEMSGKEVLKQARAE